VSIVYCPEVDRLGRNARDCLEILDILHAHGAELVLVENHIATRTPMGKLFFTLLAAFAEWEADLIKERTMSGKLEKLEQHQVAGKTTLAGDRSTPYGLRYNAPAHKGQEGEWRRVPEQARWVRFMFEQTAQGKGGDTIATMLNERGVAGPPRRLLERRHGQEHHREHRAHRPAATQDRRAGIFLRRAQDHRG
jgi:DNA invertase Pin-like site-specific DNA recombinase